jgi:hypothetical protein
MAGVVAAAAGVTGAVPKATAVTVPSALASHIHILMRCRQGDYRGALGGVGRIVGRMAGALRHTYPQDHILFPVWAAALLPALATQVAELMPAAAGHVVAAQVQRHDVPVAGTLAAKWGVRICFHLVPFLQLSHYNASVQVVF